jgi:hypothetical protein
MPSDCWRSWKTSSIHGQVRKRAATVSVVYAGCQQVLLLSCVKNIYRSPLLMQDTVSHA